MLAQTELEALCAELPAWSVDATKRTISREIRFRDFSAAWGFISRIALLAAAADHHPALWNSFNMVRIELTTHDAGEITSKDAALARAIDAMQTDYA